MQHIQHNHYQSAVSPVHLKEIEAISAIEERLLLKAQLEKFFCPVVRDKQAIRSRADYLYQLGFGIADAAHLAFAEVLADALISCDDNLLKNIKKKSLQK